MCPFFIVGMSKVIENARMRAAVTAATSIYTRRNEMKTFAKETGGFAWFRNLPEKSRDLSASRVVSAQPVQPVLQPDIAIVTEIIAK